MPCRTDRLFIVLPVSLLLALGCSGRERVGTTYYERSIAPIFEAGCVGSVAGCHRDDGTGVALGNLDLSSFEAVQRRRDVLRRHGAFPEALLLIKAVASDGLLVEYQGDFYPLEIQHGGGPVLTLGSDAYFTLKQWIDNGATENGLPPVAAGGEGVGACSDALPAGINVDAVQPDAPGLTEFAAIESYLVQTCGAGTCHGAVRADYHLTCGTSEQQHRANYIMSRAFVAGDPDDSPLLGKALDPSAGGEYHSGGSFFPTRDDPSYALMRTFAAAAGELPAAVSTPARSFFDQRVMPVLLQRGCAMEACHSAVVPFGLHLRAGSQGFFSVLARDVNYAQARPLAALESPNPIASRLVAKNVLPIKGGIAHRAGVVLETPGHPGDPVECPAPYDPVGATPLCTLAEWRRLERLELPDEFSSDLGEGSTAPLVYVARPPDAVRALVDFATYRPGADLIRAEAAIGPRATIESLAGERSLLDGCPGVGASRAEIDVRSPEPSHDGSRVTFAMRIGVADGLDVYEVGVDGGGCRQLTTDGGQLGNGLMSESFDPYYVIDEAGVEWIVYAATRGGDAGPVRTPKLFLPGADVWRQPVAGGAAERLTFLRGVEAQPFPMNNGMIGIVVEKSSAELYQVAGRRLNWDRSDYHPLVGQRKASYQGRAGYVPGEVPTAAEPVASIGYSQLSEIRNAANDDFVFVLSDAGALGEGGALGVFNRSIGPFEAGRDDPGYLKSLTVLAGPTGRAGEATGMYRSPYPLPDGTVLASYAATADPGETAPKRYELVIVTPRTGERRVLRSTTQSLVEAVLVAPRPPPPPFVHPAATSEQSDVDYAVLHYTDLPLLGTLQDANDRRGRLVDSLRPATRVRYFSHQSPPSTCSVPADCTSSLAGSQSVFESRIEIGSAPLGTDGSAFLRVPTNRPLILELLDDDGTVLFRMEEETQFGPYENINLGVPEPAYHTLCGVCHGSISGRELDLTIDVDVLTSASLSEARASGIRDLE